MSSKQLISLVVPAYNEAECIDSSIDRIHQVMKTNHESFELVIVDDGSNDATWSKIVRASATYPTVKGLRLSRNFGKESAICAGLEQTSGDAVILLDADMQHPPELIPDMIQRWRKGDVDVVEGVKSDRGRENLFSRLLAQVFYWLMGSLSGLDFAGASDYKLLDRKVVEAWKSMDERNLFFRAMSAWVGFNRVQIEFEVATREAGTSKWTQWSLVGLAFKAIAAFSTVPLRIVTVSGVLFFLFAIIMAANTLYQYWHGEAVTGFSTVILLLLITSSLIMLALGIIGEYIARIYEEVKGRPRYIIAEHTGR
ncbi:MAG TPA: glycosyltransferase family 2 protein [Mariprofundaceae bacterium]|nr:glycosyltransferase family 2 protein [Mariprofundaceae bacterium]